MSVVAGLFQEYSQADEAIQELNKIGIGKDSVSIVLPESVAHRHLKGGDSPRFESTVESTRSGAVLGGLAGLLVGVSAIVVPGIGPVITLGTLATALASTAVGAGVGAATGGLVGVLISQGIPENQAKIYAQGVEHGGVLVTVFAEGEQVKQVQGILEQHGAGKLQTRELP